MVKRAIAIGSPSALSIERRQLVMRAGHEVVQTAPLEDISIIVVDTPETTWTSSLLAECGEFGIAVVFCGAKHLPSSLLLPAVGHHQMSWVQRQQIGARLPTKKRLWQCIIMAKIRAQAEVLRAYGKRHESVSLMAAKVRSGDLGNMEGVAAAKYFRELFGKEFLRDPDLPGWNARLNYGYAVIRAAVARSIVLAGLDPGVGIWHHNRGNPFPLADDLVEPIRPLVDRIVFDSLATFPEEQDLTPPLKRFLLQVLSAELGWQGARYPLDVALERFCAQVREALIEGGTEVECPTV